MGTSLSVPKVIGTPKFGAALELATVKEHPYYYQLDKYGKKQLRQKTLRAIRAQAAESIRKNKVRNARRARYRARVALKKKFQRASQEPLAPQPEVTEGPVRITAEETTILLGTNRTRARRVRRQRIQRAAQRAALVLTERGTNRWRNIASVAVLGASGIRFATSVLDIFNTLLGIATDAVMWVQSWWGSANNDDFMIRTLANFDALSREDRVRFRNYLEALRARPIFYLLAVATLSLQSQVEMEASGRNSGVDTLREGPRYTTRLTVNPRTLLHRAALIANDCEVPAAARELLASPRIVDDFFDLSGPAITLQWYHYEGDFLTNYLVGRLMSSFMAYRVRSLATLVVRALMNLPVIGVIQALLLVPSALQDTVRALTRPLAITAPFTRGGYVEFVREMDLEWFTTEGFLGAWETSCIDALFGEINRFDETDDD